uniref:Calmodulin-binding domain-containing protein n=1 Tax=Aegilops tauschii subsp. strangulata TaxID=200361 RepID=A0A452Z016_AEGTS
MVRSKEMPKRPKDPLMTPPSKPRGFRDDDGGGFGGSLPRNRGGAAMSPAPASVPNYMRATSSSGAKAGPGRRAGAVPSSASPATRRGPLRTVTSGRVLFPTPEVPGMVRATPTCSSTMKEAKFPGALDLAPGATDAQGPAAMRVCPYNYCSLNGHTHSPAVPLRSFLASRRRLIKTQQSMKHKGVSAFRKGSGHQRPEDKNGGPVVRAAVAKAAPLVDEEALGDFFVEVYAGPRVSSDMSCSDMSLDEMDAAVRRMEFVVFDRCGVGEDDEKGGDPAVRGDGGGRPEEDRLGFCRDSSSECSDDGASGLISGNLVEELPWMRYDCDSLDDDVSEEQVQQAEVSEGQEGEDEEGRSSDNHEEEADEEQKPEESKIISDLPRETGIIAEQEGADCRVEICEDISNTTDQQEASTVQETQHEDDEERVSDVAHKMEVAAAQACIVCAAGVCNEQEEEEDQDNILGKVIQGDASDGQGTSEEKLSNGVDESEEIPEHELDILVCEPEIPENEVAERVENVLEESRVDESSADQEAKDDQSNVESTGNLEVTEKQDMPDDGSEMEISETVPSVACEEDFAEEEVTSRAVSEGEISDCSAIASLDAEISTPPAEGGFEQDVNMVEDGFEQYDGAVNNLVDQCIPAEDKVDVTEDAQKEIEITSCNLEDASEESGTAQESSQEVNFICVDAAEQMEPEPEVTNCKLEDPSEESVIAQESSQDVKPVCVDAAAQMEPEPEVANCKLEDSSEEESGIAQESSQDVKPVCVDAAAQMEPETTNCNLEDASAAAGITGETVRDDSLVYVCEVAQVQSGVDTSELVDTSEESGIAHEICADNSASYLRDDAQSDSGIATCDSGEESATVQEADQDHNCTDVNGGSANESALTPCELAEASEAYDITQEAIQDDSISDVNDGAQKESEIIACGSEHACEESDIIQEGGEDDKTAGVCAGALKEPEIIASESGDACEEVCHTEEANLLTVIQIPEHNSDFSATDGHGEPQNQPAEDNVAKEFSIDDMCNVFSGMNLKGDVYVDPSESDICPRNRMIIARRRRTPEEDEYMRGFNPRAPNFLPLESDPDAEKIDLKHQTAEDRKNAEEWMIDYALRRAVNNLGPARKKKVELLVQAFETVLPQDEKKSISPTRPAQACN